MPQPVILCGWLFPGPVSNAPAGAPFPSATCAAVLPLPYRFEPSFFGPLPVQAALDGEPPTVHVVHLPVVLLGFTPGPFAFAACLAWPGGVAGGVAGAAAGAGLAVPLPVLLPVAFPFGAGWLCEPVFALAWGVA